MPANPDCRYCHGTGQVVDYVPYGSTNVPMHTECDCVEYPIFIKFLTDTTCNDTDDVVEIKTEDETHIHYIGGYGGWCYLPKSLENEIFIYVNDN